MNDTIFLELTNQALMTAAILCVPILIPALITGILISLFQAVTQINEQTLTFIPKLIVLIFSYMIAGPWLVKYMSDYAIELFGKIPAIGGG